MKHIVSFSTGLSSALTAERVLQRYGASEVEIVFMDTTIEDDDNYRFMREMVARWLNVYGYEGVTVLRDGRDPYQVAIDRQIIPNQKIAPCTLALKIDPFTTWAEQRFSGQSVTVHVGYDFSEVDRCAATRTNYEAYGWRVDFPLLWRPIEHRPYTDICRQEWGIEPPRMYEMGYSHANCGGRCVKQGAGDWLRTLINFPERFKQSEDFEIARNCERFERHVEKGRPLGDFRLYTFVRDQRGDGVKPKLLKTLREEHQAGRAGQLSLLDFQAPCVYCGVGDLLARAQ